MSSGTFYKIEKLLFGLGFSEADLDKDPLSFSGGYQIRINLVKLLATEPNILPLEESLQVTAKEMNKALPAMVDAEIRHDKVEIHGLNLILKFTLVNFTKDIMDAQKLNDIMEYDIRRQVCADVDSQRMLKQGMKMIYDYSDKNKKHIMKFVYDAKVCNLFTNIDQIKQTLMNIYTTEELTRL